jgi:ferredoxin, 2Fe-2S
MGINPYLDNEIAPPPAQKYKLTVEETGVEIEVDPESLPEGHEGSPGSLLSLLLAQGIEIDHTCGGVSACSTCHIYVTKGGESAPEPSEAEEDQLDFAPAVRDTSRLSCQCVPDGSEDVSVSLPTWKRNEVSEEH